MAAELSFENFLCDDADEGIAKALGNEAIVQLTTGAPQESKDLDK